MMKLLSSVCLAAICASPALAQTSPSGTPDSQAQPATSGSGTEIGEIVVTAQRRAEAMQDVPIAIAAFSRDQLQATQVKDTLDLKSITPGLVINTAAAGFVNPRIRGVGTSATGPGIESPIAVYVDGVYFASANSTLFSLNDVDQVAVLKGPQGTLFGRNATGGLIQITTRKPSSDLTADAHITYGNLDRAMADAYVSGPIASGLSASIAGTYDYQGKGFGKNLYNGRDVQDHRNYAGRAKLYWEDDSSSITLSGDYSKMRATDPVLRILTPLRFNQGSTPGGPRDIASDINSEVEIKAYGGSLTAKHLFGGVELMSVSAYRHTQYHALFDLDGTTIPFQYINLNQGDWQYSEELQLQSQGTGPFQWTVGGMYFQSRSAYNPSAAVFPIGNQFSTPPLPAGAQIINDSTLRLKSYAAYGQGTYKFGDSTNLTLGLRYTTDKRTINAVKFILPFNATIPGSIVDDGERFSKVTWRASLDHRFSPELLVYASYNRGFKSGTFDAASTDATRPGNGRLVLPEVLDAFEIGFKSDLFDRRVRFNLATYYYDYKNSQVVIIRNGFVQLYNGEGAKTYGVDADTTIRVTKELTLNLGASYLHGRYKGFKNAVATRPMVTAGLCNGVFQPAGGDCIGNPGSADATGNRLQNTPDVTLSASAVYTIPTSFGDFALAGNYYYNDGYYSEPENRLRQQAYSIVDASITWSNPAKSMDIRVWGKNLNDAVYAAQLTANDAGDIRTAAPGRTYGVTLGLKF